MYGLLLLVLLASETIQSPVDFDTQVMPVLTKAGCTAGACHGSAAGRGEFRLSLYGTRPTEDYDEIVRVLEGRRINRSHPDDSLLLQKPTEQLSHEGGTRLDVDGNDFQIVRRWIEEGANRIQRRRLVGFQFEAAQDVVISIGDSVTLTAVATFDDGAHESVVPWTVFRPDDPSAVEVLESGIATVRRTGRHVIVARYLDRVAAVELIVPFAGTNKLAFRLSPVANASQSVSPDSVLSPNVDFFVDRKLQRLNISAAGCATDSQLARRLYLDLCGRLPTPEEVHVFVASAAADKLEQLIDRLLASPDYIEFWTFRLANAFRVGPRSSPAYYKWIRECVANDVAYNVMVRQLLQATGDIQTNGPANFYAVSGDPRATVELVSSLFLGVRMQCANCHDHPLDVWTQDDYHGMAAVFANVKSGAVVTTGRGEVIHPVTGEAAIPRIPGQRFMTGDLDQRIELSAWITSQDNPFFRRALVNRVWNYLMGQGLVEPIDDLRSTNPATHPQLLQWLAEDFGENNHSLRLLVRTICRSNAYQRSGKVSGQAIDLGFYSFARPQVFSPAVFLDAVTDVTYGTGGTTENGNVRMSRAVSLFGLTSKVGKPNNGGASIVEPFGGCDPGRDCSLDTVATSELAIQLQFLNGELLNQLVRAPDGELMQCLASEIGPDELVQRFYQKAYSRSPNDRECVYWKQVFADVADRQQLVDVAQDFVWSLLNSKEFFTIR